VQYFSPLTGFISFLLLSFSIYACGCGYIIYLREHSMVQDSNACLFTKKASSVLS
jgi:hypothetical protein